MVKPYGLLCLALSMALAGCAFAPEPTTERDESIDLSGLQEVSAGAWEDADSAHRASGTVTVYRGDDGALIHFEDFEATSGPDVYLYASPHDAAEDLDDAIKVRVPGGEGDGRATVRGTFTVPLPDGLDPASIRSLVLWCDDFSVHFGTADLS